MEGKQGVPGTPGPVGKPVCFIDICLHVHVIFVCAYIIHLKFKFTFVQAFLFLSLRVLKDQLVHLDLVVPLGHLEDLDCLES